MRFYLIPLGFAGVLVGLGFVCPQIANIRESRGLGAIQSSLLLFGVALSIAGVVGLTLGTRWLLVRRS